MSARDALPTGLALGARHAPDVRLRDPFGALVTIAALYYLVTGR